MENVDTCVCCGRIIPEGRMICCRCSESDRDTDFENIKNNVTLFLLEDLNLKWYQKLWLKLYYVSLKQLSRKGLYRYF